MSDIDTFSGIADTRALAMAMVDAVVAPLLVLDHELRVVTANRSFYLKFKVDRQATQGCLLYELGGGDWDIPGLRTMLEKLLPERGSLDGYEVEGEFSALGRRTMILSARQVLYANGGPPSLLLGIDDITERRVLERRLERLLEQKDVLLQELQHRVANSLAIIASILLLKARTVDSEETRRHLQDAHARVMSLATVQNHLHATGRGGSVDVAPYLTQLCQALAASMIAKDSDISMQVEASDGALSSGDAVSLGLIVTELIINSLKHAFRGGGLPDPRIVVVYTKSSDQWTLTVSDNGGGIAQIDASSGRPGLGRSIVDALAHQLGARVTVQTGNTGTATAIVRKTGV
jgi:chemotaxis protein methyltransferase CheR